MKNLLLNLDAKTAGVKTYALVFFGVLYLVLKVANGDASLEEVLPEALNLLGLGTLRASVNRAIKE